MNYSQKYPISISEDGDTIESGFTNVNSEFSQLFSDLSTTLSPNGHTHEVIDIIDFPSGGYVPVGGVIIWTGYLDNIPEHWHLCDGTNGTPDLRNRFIVGAGLEVGTTSTFNFSTDYSENGTGYYAAYDSGGKDRHILTAHELADHKHEVYGRYGSLGSYDVGMLATRETYKVVTDYTGLLSDNENDPYCGFAHENRPLYLALAYIMRLS